MLTSIIIIVCAKLSFNCIRCVIIISNYDYHLAFIPQQIFDVLKELNKLKKDLLGLVYKFCSKKNA